MMLNVPSSTKTVAKRSKNYAIIQTKIILTQLGLFTLHMKKRTNKLALKNLYLKLKQIWDVKGNERNPSNLERDDGLPGYNPSSKHQIQASGI